MKREKVCLTLPKKIVDNLRKVKKETGLSIARQVEMELSGFKISKKVNK